MLKSIKIWVQRHHHNSDFKIEIESQPLCVQAALARKIAELPEREDV